MSSSGETSLFYKFFSRKKKEKPPVAPPKNLALLIDINHPDQKISIKTHIINKIEPPIFKPITENSNNFLSHPTDKFVTNNKVVVNQIVLNGAQEANNSAKDKFSRKITEMISLSLEQAQFVDANHQNHHHTDSLLDNLSK